MVTWTLDELIVAESRKQPFPAAVAMADHLRTHYGAGVRAIVFYGSCLRLGTDKDLMLDFYVLVDRLSESISHPFSALIGAILPPNVYYHEHNFDGRAVRAKVAVMTLEAFVRGTARRTLAPALWARFAQPAAILYAANDDAQNITTKALTDAVTSLVSNTLPLLNGPFSIRELWVTALRAAYDTELRPEASTKADKLFDANPERFNAVGIAALIELGVDPLSPRLANSSAKWLWRLRSIWGRSLNLLRLIKAVFTFRGGLKYAIWKLERHSSEKTQLIEKD